MVPHQKPSELRGQHDLHLLCHLQQHWQLYHLF
uniref:Uncharacterized protein n=1 Tax=Lotus japonicus TaxID=34305 RepID=I3SX19_LOTJA|nr:unknown [Lotus japonicus]